MNDITVTIPLMEFELLKKKVDALEALQSNDKITVFYCWWSGNRVIINRSDEWLNKLRNDVNIISTQLINNQHKSKRWEEFVFKIRNSFS